MSHVSVEPDLIAERMALKSVQDARNALQAMYAGKKVIVGIDNSERLKV